MEPSSTKPPFDQIDHRLLEKIEEFDAPYLEEKLLRAGEFSTPEQYREAFKELKRFLYISSKSTFPIEMSSEPIDNVWHQFILFTPQYQDFCLKHFGKFIHHQPITSYTPLKRSGTDFFIKEYSKTFGKLSDFWI